MALVINSNIQSLSSQNSLNKAQDAKETAMDRLSSGKRINSAADDAAGLAISTKMTSQIKGLNQAMRNANDGVSMIQTAEGALDQSQNILQRMRELSVQSANGTYQEGNRDTMNAEVEQLKAELDRIGETTKFNGINLFDQDDKKVALQIGNEAGQTLEVGLDKVSTDTLGKSDKGGVSAQGTDNALKEGDLFINGVKIGPSDAADDQASTDNNAASAIAKAAAINRETENSGVRAEVEHTHAAGTTMVGATASGKITLNDVEIDISTNVDTAVTRESVMAAINAKSEQSGVKAVDTGDDNTGITLVTADDRYKGMNIELSFGTGLTAENTGLAQAGTYEGGFTLVAEAGTKSIEISGGNGTGTGNLSNSGLSEGSFKAGEVAVTSTALSTTGAANSTANLTIELANSSAATIAGQADTINVAVNGSTSGTGTANVNSAKELAVAVANHADVKSADAFTSVEVTGMATWGDGDVTAAGFSITTSAGTIDIVDGSAAATLDDMVEQINTKGKSDLAGDVTARLNAAGDGVIIESASGENLAFDVAGAGGGALSMGFQQLNSDGTASSVAAVAPADVGGGGNDAIIRGQVEKIEFEQGAEISEIRVAAAGAATTLIAAAGGVESANAGTLGDMTAEKGNVLEAGDLTINGVEISATNSVDDTASYTGALSSKAEASGIATAAAINAKSEQTGVNATVNETVLVGRTASSAAASTSGYGIGDSGALHVNGVEVGSVTLQNDGSGAVDYAQARKDAADTINSASKQTGVTAEITGDALTLRAEDGRNIVLAVDNNSQSKTGTPGDTFGLALGLDATVAGIGEGDVTGAMSADRIAETTHSTVTLTSANEIEIGTGTEGSNGAADNGFQVADYGNGASGQYLKDIDISTADGATKAIDAIDNALDALSQQRSDLGAAQNRLDFTVENLTNTVENATTARSRIEDTDYASESANLSRAQVLQQASQTMLAQANSAPQQVLSLLQ